MRWVYLAIVVVFVAAAIIFSLQNMQSVAVAFLALAISAPLAIVVFVVYVLGAATRWKPVRAPAHLHPGLAARVLSASRHCDPVIAT